MAGTVSVGNAADKSGALAAKKKGRKRKLRLRPASAGGGPGEIVVALRLVGNAKQRFKATGRAKVRARISFAPSRQCVRCFSSCYDAGAETARVRKPKKKRK